MKKNPGRVITTDIQASLVGQLSVYFCIHSIEYLSGFKKTGIYPFNPSAVNDQQLAPSTALSHKPSASTKSTTATVPEQPSASTKSTTATVPEQPLSEDRQNGEAEPVLFSPEKEEIFARWFEEGTPPTPTATPEQPVSDDKVVDDQPGFLPEKEKCLAPLLGESTLHG